MACPGEGILTDLARRLVDKTIKEVNYFRHCETHGIEFGREKQLLIRRVENVKKDIEDAKRNEYEIEGEVQDWIEEANNLIQTNAEIRQTRFDSWCPLRQYRQGKRLAQMTPAIKDHIEKFNSDRVARPAELPGIKYHASRDFIDFESRKKKFKQLVEALEGGNHYMIGLQGMGGTGKTTLATQVGKKVEESKSFDKVIFVVVSNPPDINKIRGDIARPLGLKLEERVEADHSKLLWSRISDNKEKLLIILDDVWGELNLIEIGIPSGLDRKNCYVLITTRDLNVCQKMRCQQIVHLRTLDDDDALRLFQFHARSTDDYGSSINELEGLAKDFLKECGGLPVAIVALASTLRNRHVGEWNAALKDLQMSKLIVDVDEDLVNVYRCLRLSYDNLHNEKAQQLFLLCSIFPEDYEFPIDLISRLAIGSGIFEEANEYRAARSRALKVKNKLIDSSLLQKVGEKECVKMHDLVREVAQWIAKEDIQVIKDSRTTLKTDKKFVFWSVDDFPDQFDGTKLEILLLWISGKALVKDPHAFFVGMSRLKILLLLGEYDGKVPSPSLSTSLLSLKKIHTLILDSWEIGDLSVLKNLQSLVTLELTKCLINELPKDFMELKSLRWLGLRSCEIQRNNPFKVIERCSQLEELYFVENYDVDNWKPEDDKEIEDGLAHDTSAADLQIFSVAYDGFESFPNDDNGLLRCFNPENVKHLIPDALFKYLVRSAEVLELGKIGQTRWKNLAPDVIPLENAGMDNLIKLYLYEWDDIECLVDNSKYHYSNATFFSKLVELHLFGVDIKTLYLGAMPSSFLRQLQILKLKMCVKLENIFFDEHIKLLRLRVLRLKDCPMFQPSVFPASVAQSLERLEKLVVKDCEGLKSLIAHESLEEEMRVVGSKKNNGLLFPELKSLLIEGCGKLEMVLPLHMSGDLPKLEDLSIFDCEELKYMFGEYKDLGQVLQHEIILPLLTEVYLRGVPSLVSILENCKKCVVRPPQVFKDSKEKHENSKTSAFSRACGCCFMVPTIMEHDRFSQGSCGSSKRLETLHTAECLIRQPISLQNIRELSLWRCSKLKSLFSASIATTIMLEKLEIWECEELKHLITNEAKDDDHLNCTSIFPKLQSLHVSYCNKLEFIFPSTLSGGLQKLKSIYICEALELKYVFEKYNEEDCVSNENQNSDIHIHLPALESLSLLSVPNMMSIATKRYEQKCPSLQIAEAPEEIKKHMQDMTSERAKESELQVIVNVDTPLTQSVGQYFLNFHNLKEIQILRNQKLKSLFSISACRNLAQLSELTISACEELVNVVENDSNDHRRLNSSSIFPKLEKLYICDCNKLQFIFPLSFSSSLQKLKSLEIKEATKLECIFGKHHDGDYLSNENESDEPHIHLPTTLERLSFVGVPNIINKILAEKYHLSFLSLQSIELGDLQDFNGRSFLDFMTYLQDIQLNKKSPKDLMKMIKNVQKLTKLEARDSKIEEVLDLEHVEIEGTVLTLNLEEMWLQDLSELRHICNGPKNILSLQNLCGLYIIACKKLRVIFSVSIIKSLPKLLSLTIEDCDELVGIIEESYDDHLHQICFPKLQEISIERCNSLKCLFSISTCGVFPGLWSLRIQEASEIEQVFLHKHDDDTQKMTVMKEVFPNLSYVTLRKLPRLITICEGIDFQTMTNIKVIADDCPKYQGNNHIQEGPEDGDLENEAATNASPDFAESKKETVKEREAKDPTPELLEKQPLEGSTAKPQLASTSLHNHEETEKGGGRVVVPDPASKSPAPTSSSFQILETGQEVAGIASQSPVTTTSSCSNSKRNVENIPKDTTTRNLLSASITALHEEIPLDLKKKEFRSGSTMMTNQQTLADKTSSVGNFQEYTTTMKDKIDTFFIQTQAESSQSNPPTMSGIENITGDSTPMIAKMDSSLIHSQTKDSQSDPPVQVASVKETHEQCSPKDDAIEEATTAIESRKQSTEPIDLLSRKDSALSAKETAKGMNEKARDTSPMATLFTRALNIKEGRDHSSVQEEAESEKPIKVIIPQVTPSLHQQSKIVDAGTTSYPNKLGVCEIFQLVELKDGETALLAQALERYPQLLLPQKHRSQRMIAWSYRVLVDMLVVLATKTPSSITSSEKSTLETNLCDATLLGFDKEWVDSVRARVFGADMSDELAAEEEIQVKEAELETCDIALEQVRKQRVEAKEKLAVARRQLEMTQTEFEAIDSQLSGLLQDRKKLVTEITEFREIISAKDRPFGI